MRFTHPVNTLKKLGCGLAFGAAAIMAMPTSALACTQIYMGSKLTADGNTYYGRSEDFGPRYVKHFGIEPAHKDGNEYTSVESGFEYKSKGATYRYTFVRDNPSQWEDRYDAYSEAGINEKGVSCSATLSTSYNEKAEEADPITEETGIGEYSYASVILGESATAREGVELIGSLIDEQGVCSNRNTEIHTFQIRQGMDPEIATIQWEMLSNAEFSVAIPFYSALLTEVSPYFSDQDVSFDHCEEEDVVNNEEPKNSINYVLMDINTLAYENRDHCATGVRAYLDALQKELIEQNLTVDEAMQAEEGTEARTALANKAGKAATKNTYVKCKAMLEEMRDYLKEGDFSEEFVPSDYDADNDCLVESITYADEALSDEDVTEPEAEEEEVTEEKSEGNNMAAMAVGAVVIIGVCAYVIYRRKKA